MAEISGNPAAVGHSSPRLTVRRNLNGRLAGFGYSVVTTLWLVLLETHSSHPSHLAAAILFVLALMGLAVAANRDDVSIDAVSRTVTRVTGLPGFTKEQTYAFADLAHVAIQEGGTLRPGADATGPFAHRWCSVRLETRDGASLPLWSLAGDEDAEENQAMLQTAQSKATAIATMIGVPVSA